MKTEVRFDRKPDWIRVKLPAGERYQSLKGLVRQQNLNTVCEDARCPNIEECWNGGTATLMLMGDTCTRGCRFCSVKSGNPKGWLDPNEPNKVATTVAQLGLSYVVLTSVDRDDLPDGGSAHFAATVRAIKRNNPKVIVETLIPDFNADTAALDVMMASSADVIAQNLETVRRLTSRVRDPRSGYEKTLRVLGYLKTSKPSLFTKSSLMLGLGETDTETYEAMDDLLAVGVDILTLGQYLRPTQKHLQVEEYVHPTKFDTLAEVGRKKGFKFVAAGPLVRSSYRAGELFVKNILSNRKGVL